jgi:tRNA U34 2-thiouridine synthase MnmA/TrmU
MVKAILLLSTGLDSFLAYKILKRLGIETIVLVIKTPFNKINEEILKEIKKESKVIIHEAKEDYLEIIKNPKFGYGKQMNPCIDCKIYMYKIAKEYLEKENADFIATGEVLNQRKFSQTLDKLKLIEREAKVENLVLRPLSAKLLPETIAEKKGLIKRENLLDIKGRSRKKQLELVKELKIEKFPKPSAGCLLVDPSFSKRLRDLINFNPNFNLEDVELLKIGRHFRINGSKLILGRNEEENKKLEKYKKYILLKPKSKGPIGIFIGEEKDLKIAVEILVSYCKDEKVVVKIIKDENVKEVEIIKKDKNMYKSFLIA